MNLNFLLMQRGLSEREAKTYLCCLELGSAPAASIARRIQENRITTYSLLKRLVILGVAYSLVRNNVTYYSVISPEEMAAKLEQKYVMFKDALPDFLSLSHGFDNKPMVHFYDGVEGIIRVYKEVLKAEGSVRMIQGMDYVKPEVKKFIDDYFVPHRIKNNIQAKVIGPKTPSMTSYSKYDKKSLRTMKLVDPAELQFTNEIMIYNENTVAIALHSHDEGAGIVIYSKNLADSLRGIFDLLRKYLPM